MTDVISCTFHEQLKTVCFYTHVFDLGMYIEPGFLSSMFRPSSVGLVIEVILSPWIGEQERVCILPSRLCVAGNCYICPVFPPPPEVLDFMQRRIEPGCILCVLLCRRHVLVVWCAVSEAITLPASC